jgi:hypothetical protein
VEPPLPDPRTERQRAALEKAAAVKKALAEKRALAEQQKREKAEARRRAAEEREARKVAAAERKRNGSAKAAAAAAPPAVAASDAVRAAPPATQAVPEPAPQPQVAVAAREPAAAPAGEKRAPPPPSAQPHRPSQKLAMAGGHHITGIGFRPVQGGEVIVRSDGPLEYGISGEGKSVLLHLPSTAIPVANNRRPLDTQFFAGAVQRVVPLPVEGGTDVRIELRERAEYQLAQSGSVLTVTFSAPQ